MIRTWREFVEFQRMLEQDDTPILSTMDGNSQPNPQNPEETMSDSDSEELTKASDFNMRRAESFCKFLIVLQKISTESKIIDKLNDDFINFFTSFSNMRQRIRGAYNKYDFGADDYAQIVMKSISIMSGGRARQKFNNQKVRQGLIKQQSEATPEEEMELNKILTALRRAMGQVVSNNIFAKDNKTNENIDNMMAILKNKFAEIRNSPEWKPVFIAPFILMLLATIAGKIPTKEDRTTNVQFICNKIKKAAMENKKADMENKKADMENEKQINLKNQSNLNMKNNANTKKQF